MDNAGNFPTHRRSMRIPRELVEDKKCLGERHHVLEVFETLVKDLEAGNG